MITVLIVISLLFVISVCINVYLGMSLDRRLDEIDVLNERITDFKNNINSTYKRLKLIDDKQMFEKDDDVGFVFSEIVELVEKTNNI
jgi:hypothetical protein